jgi:hypothetical protein
MIAIALFTAQALASARSLAAEIGIVGTEDPRFADTFDATTLGSFGLRGTYPVHPHLGLVLGWQHAAIASTVGTWIERDAQTANEDDIYVEDEASGYYDDWGGSETAIGLWTDRVSLGVKGDWAFTRWVTAYATLSAVGMHGLLVVDSDRDHTGEDDPTQRSGNGFTGGAMGTAGIEFTVPLQKEGPLSFCFYTEAGYEWLAPVTLGDLGGLQLAGFTGRMGTGLRF